MDRVAEGTVLAGKYRLERKLGQGGMGAVWRAEHLQLRSPVAVKLIDEQIIDNPEALARFMREAQSAAALRSPHVVQILDFGADEGMPYIAMELLDGESLATRIAARGRLSPLEVSRLINEVSRALAKAHELGVVHRDMKPDNVFIVRNDEEEVAKVLDFGIAKAAGFGSTGSSTRTGAILGTPYYMSPEQAEGTRAVDHRTDLWALGVIAFECLLGRRPFESDALGGLLLAICARPIPVPSSFGNVPPGFDAWFARACARELPDRFDTARGLAHELRRVCGASRDGRDSTPHEAAARPPFGSLATLGTDAPYTLAPRNGRARSDDGPPLRRRSRALAIGGLVLGLSFAASALLIWGLRSSPNEAVEAAPRAAAAPAPQPASPPAAGAESPAAKAEPDLLAPTPAPEPELALAPMRTGAPAVLPNRTVAAPVRRPPATRRRSTVKAVEAAPDRAPSTPAATASPKAAAKVDLGI